MLHETTPYQFQLVDAAGDAVGLDWTHHCHTTQVLDEAARSLLPKHLPAEVAALRLTAPDGSTQLVQRPS
jgi:hypothetical protein